MPNNPTQQAESKGEWFYNFTRRLLSRTAYVVRKKFFDLFMKIIQPTAETTILDVGVNGETLGEGDNYFEKLYPWPNKITAVGVQDASILEKQYPGLTFIRSDGKGLPFPDNSFDVVFCAAVVEHVGSFENQKKLFAECLRVGKRIFMTTPDRLFPFEAHTALPFLHWLPKPMYRRLLRSIGLNFFADEANLNLMTKSEVRKAVAGRVDVRVFRKINSIIAIKEQC